MCPKWVTHLVPFFYVFVHHVLKNNISYSHESIVTVLVKISYILSFHIIIHHLSCAPELLSLFDFARCPCHRGDESRNAGGAAGRAVVRATNAVVLDGLASEKELEMFVFSVFFG